MPTLLVLFIVVPLIEIALFLTVGNRIGIIPTIAIVIVTAVIGSFFVSRQGRSQVAQISESVGKGAMPGAELAHGAMILVAAVLLITPGFLTDVVGFLLLVPPVRETIRKIGQERLRNRVQIL